MILVQICQDQLAIKSRLAYLEIRQMGLGLVRSPEGQAPMSAIAATVLERGFAIVPRLIDDEAASALEVAVERSTASAGTLRREDAVYGMRDLLRGVPEIRTLAGSPVILDLVESILGPGAFAVRGLWFDKTAGANWGVPWHQDLTIAIKERISTAGFGPWTLKAGINHVRPPVDVLTAMVTVRLHIDDCHAGAGAAPSYPGFASARTARR